MCWMHCGMTVKLGTFGAIHTDFEYKFAKIFLWNFKTYLTSLKHSLLTYKVGLIPYLLLSPSKLELEKNLSNC